MQPTIERLAETLDKFEEDLFDVRYPQIRGTRRVVIKFGEPIEPRASGDKRDSAAELTRSLEVRVQSLLDEINAETNGRNRSTASACDR